MSRPAWLVCIASGFFDHKLFFWFMVFPQALPPEARKFNNRTEGLNLEMSYQELNPGTDECASASGDFIDLEQERYYRLSNVESWRRFLSVLYPIVIIGCSFPQQAV
jgi:hypothetical protein